MNQQENAKLIGQLEEDLRWLESYCSQQPGRLAEAGHLRLAAALVRNCIAPYLSSRSADPLHVVVVGGAGAGKSTVVNLLAGARVAEANPQAGFTRHPTAFAQQNGSAPWGDQAGFLGPLKRLDAPAPANLDEDVYQIRSLPNRSGGVDLLSDFVLWDCPDMTTWASTNYVTRLMEVAALADVIVYVASDERYNDEVPTQFLQILLQTGKPVIVCLTKMHETATGALIEHFKKAVLTKLGSPALACLAIPNLTPAQQAEMGAQSAVYRIPLVNQVAVLGQPAASARRRVVWGAAQFLRGQIRPLLDSVRRDLEALADWRALVRQGQNDFDTRYRNEYLTSEKFRSFDEALVRLLELLELPGVGRMVSGALWVLRTPYRLAREWIWKGLARPAAPSLPEARVLLDALDAWLDHLRKESLRRSGELPFWKYVADGFKKGLAAETHERFEHLYSGFQLSLTQEVQQTARAIYEELEKNPLLLNTLRSGNLALDVAAVGGALTIGHIGLHDVILVPLMASVKQQIVEILGRQYVENQREQIRQRQRTLVSEHLSRPLAGWLEQWPTTGGSQFERLELMVKRLPGSIMALEKAIESADEPKVVGAASSP